MIRISKRTRESVEDDSTEVGDALNLDSLEVGLKKVRISYTPGQLRLHKDMEVMKNKFRLQITAGTNSSSCIVHLPLSGEKFVRYLIEVPRYYPHSPPIVKCLDYSMIGNAVDNTGRVMERSINEEWTAICSIETVLQALNNVNQYILLSTGCR